MYYVYVLRSLKEVERHYVGMSDDLVRRLKQHNIGRNKSTKAYLPWEIVLKEPFESREEARKREKYLKSAAGRKWRKLNIRPRGATE